MPYCTNCGARVDASASFCSACGFRQTAAPAPSELLEGMSDRTACILCYIPVFGVLACIIFLASQRFRLNYRVRFNAFQGLYLFVAWLIVSSAGPILLPGGLMEWGLFAALKLVLFVCWIYLLIKAANEEQVHLPIIGELAAKSTQEQL